MEFRFRPLVDDDLPTMHRWLNEPGIIEWWEGDDVTWERVVRDYSTRRVGDGVEHWIVDHDGVPFGWISCADIDHWPVESQAWRALGVGPHTAGIDYLIGDPGRRALGLGSRMIAAFVRHIVFGLHPTWTQVGADPFSANRASWGALARAGFQFVGTYDEGDEESRLMVFDRPSQTESGLGGEEIRGV